MRGKKFIKPRMCKVNVVKEPHVSEFKFTKHKFNIRKKPSQQNTIIFPCFSEFGTEVLGTLYCIPQIMKSNWGKYSIAVGWKGRAFLYSNIVDEFWELDDEHQWLREYCRAFHHVSKNLRRLETEMSKEGKVIPALEIGVPAVYPALKRCALKGCMGLIAINEDNQQCVKCGALWPAVGLFHDLEQGKKKAKWPKISESKKKEMSKYIKPNSVGITARNRMCYGRNLPIDFYERLLVMLRDAGYNPIWIGEPQSTHKCPLDWVTDFSKTEDSLDLENTIALVSQLKFTIQYWTASTRLAGLAGTPYLLFESPDQICGGAGTPGHEGYRMYLCSKGDHKLVLAHFNDIALNHEKGLELTKRAIDEMAINNYNDIVGSVFDKNYWYGNKSSLRII